MAAIRLFAWTGILILFFTAGCSTTPPQPTESQPDSTQYEVSQPPEPDAVMQPEPLPAFAREIQLFRMKADWPEPQKSLPIAYGDCNGWMERRDYSYNTDKGKVHWAWFSDEGKCGDHGHTLTRWWYRNDTLVSSEYIRKNVQIWVKSPETGKFEIGFANDIHRAFFKNGEKVPSVMQYAQIEKNGGYGDFYKADSFPSQGRNLLASYAEIDSLWQAAPGVDPERSYVFAGMDGDLAIFEHTPEEFYTPEIFLRTTFIPPNSQKPISTPAVAEFLVAPDSFIGKSARIQYQLESDEDGELRAILTGVEWTENF